MRSKAIVFAVASAVIMYCASAFAAGETGSKVGVINLQKILIESRAGKEAKAAFEKDLDAKRAVLATREKTARGIEEELKTGGAKMKADVRKAKEERLAEDIKELRRLKQDMEDELKKKDSELSTKIFKDIFEITKKIGAEGKYSLILQAGPQIMYIDSVTDITAEVLRRYDSGR